MSFVLLVQPLGRCPVPTGRIWRAGTRQPSHLRYRPPLRTLPVTSRCSLVHKATTHPSMAAPPPRHSYHGAPTQTAHSAYPFACGGLRALTHGSPGRLPDPCPTSCVVSRYQLGALGGGSLLAVVGHPTWPMDLQQPQYHCPAHHTRGLCPPSTIPARTCPKRLR